MFPNNQLAPQNTPAQVLVFCEPSSGKSEIINMLLERNYGLHFAAKPKEAFEILRKTDIQLIVAGVHLEESDSYEFLNKVKTSASWKQIPFVFLCLKQTPVSRYVDHALELAAKALGATKYVSCELRSRDEIQAEIASCLAV